MYDVLRDNIGLLQPINEFSLPWSKKPTRWQRFKSFLGRNKGKIAAGALGLGAGALAGDYALYRKSKKDWTAYYKKSPDMYDIDEKNNTIKFKPEYAKKYDDHGHIKIRYRPFGLGSELVDYDENGKVQNRTSFSRKEAIKNMFSKSD